MFILPSVLNYLLNTSRQTISVFATCAGCEIRYVGTTELRNIPYLSGRTTCTINSSAKETSILRLKTWMLSFLKESKYVT